MKLTVLADNNTLIDQYFLGEPGVSYFIECNQENYLFDTGYSDVFISNAAKMNINLKRVTGVILSHGHNDHTWGLSELTRVYAETTLMTKPSLILHPDAFLDKQDEALDIGMMLPVKVLSKTFTVTPSTTPLWLNENLVFLGEIPRYNAFEAKSPVGKTLRHGKWEDDFVFDDSALVYKSLDGLVVITGCAHAGICNTIQYAMEVLNERKVKAVIGGFHLLGADLNRLNSTADYFSKLQPEAVYAGHCTDLSAKIRLSQAANVLDFGVGLVLEY